MITRHDWTREQIQALLDLPLFDLLWQAQQVHRAANPGYRVQLASLLSVKTGGCEEDCAYRLCVPDGVASAVRWQGARGQGH